MLKESFFESPRIDSSSIIELTPQVNGNQIYFVTVTKNNLKSSYMYYITQKSVIVYTNKLRQFLNLIFYKNGKNKLSHFCI